MINDTSYKEYKNIYELARIQKCYKKFRNFKTLINVRDFLKILMMMFITTVYLRERYIQRGVLRGGLSKGAYPVYESYPGFEVSTPRKRN